MKKYYIVIPLLFFVITIFSCASNPAKKDYNTGFNLLNNNNYENAIEYFYKAIESDPFYAEAYSQLGFSYFKLNDIEKAIYYINRSIEINPNSARNYLYLGYIHKDNNNYTEAIKHLNKCLELDSKIAQAYAELGIIYTHTRQHNLAINIITEAIILEPNNSSNYINRAINYIEIKDFVKAFDDLTKTIELNPNNDNAYALRAAILYQEFDYYTNALNDATRSLEINSNNTIAKNVIAQAERDGVTLTERRTANIEIIMKIGSTIDEYMRDYPYLVPTSINRLVDRRSISDGVLFQYTFDEITKKITAITWVKYSQERRIRQDWFDNFLRQFIANGDDLEEINKRTSREIWNHTSMSPDHNVYRILQINEEFASLTIMIIYDK